MKRSFLLAAFRSGFLAWLLMVGAVQLRADNPAAEAAARQEAEERYQKLRGSVDDVLASQTTLQKRVGALADEIRSVQQDAEKSTGRFVARDELAKELARLTDAIREVDKRREEDRKLILDEIRKLAAAPVPEPAPRSARPNPVAPLTDPAATGPQKGYEYEVKADDTVAAIVSAYRANGVKVTVAEVLKANPGLNPNKLRVRQKIYIPDPSLK